MWSTWPISEVIKKAVVASALWTYAIMHVNPAVIMMDAKHGRKNTKNTLTNISMLIPTEDELRIMDEVNALSPEEVLKLYKYIEKQ